MKTTRAHARIPDRPFWFYLGGQPRSNRCLPWLVLLASLLASQIATAAQTNIARLSETTFSASSETVAKGQLASKVGDGLLFDKSAEWATLGEKAGAWVQLNWPQSYVVDSVTLFDRGNANDQVRSGRLLFSDGSSVSFGVLNNAGAGVPIYFSPRTINSVRLVVDSVATTTVNIGLGEFQIMGALAPDPNNSPPVANAGYPQVAKGGAMVQLVGSASYDPDEDPITYAWTQVSGTPVQLSSSAVANPMFTAPTALNADQELEFSLTVSDGHLSASANVTVKALVLQSQGAVNIAKLPETAFSASSETTEKRQLASKVADGLIGTKSGEWATLREGAGAWIELAWLTPREVDRVVLYDRANTNDQVLSGRLIFEDGYTVNVGALSNNGGPVTISFPARAIDGLRFLVDSVSSTTVNIGLAEMEVFSAESPCSVYPSARIHSPEAGYLQGGDDLTVQTVSCFDPVLHAGWGVRIALENGPSNDVYAAPYDTQFLDLARAEYTITTRLLDASGVMVDGLYAGDSASPVGIGDYFVAIGDSITKGQGDDVVGDDWSEDGRNGPTGDPAVPGGGYEPILNDLLTAFRAYPNTVENEGIKGIKSSGGLAALPNVLLRHPSDSTFLIKYGMNDSSPPLPIPSGLGLTVGDAGYPGTFKDNMQRIIDLIVSNGSRVALAKVNPIVAETLTGPFVSDPESLLRNDIISEYNQVVEELRAENLVETEAPDFYTHFLDGQRYLSEYDDAVHPNGAGYISIAELWFQVLITNP